MYWKPMQSYLFGDHYILDVDLPIRYVRARALLRTSRRAPLQLGPSSYAVSWGKPGFDPSL